MKKVLIIIVLSMLLMYTAIRFMFSYTIVDVPKEFGTRRLYNGDKYYFPICIVNPLTTKPVKENILNSVKQILEKKLPYTDDEIEAVKYAVNYRLPYDKEIYSEICYYEGIKWMFHDCSNKIQDFDIISVTGGKRNTINYFLTAYALQAS